MKTALTSSLLTEVNETFISGLSKERNEPEAIRNLRLSAYEKAKALPWPNSKDEKWKRTPVQSLPWNGFSLKAEPKEAFKSVLELPASLTELLPGGLENGNRAAVFADDLSAGYFHDTGAKDHRDTLEWISLDEAFQRYPGQIETLWTQSIERAKTNKFALLTLAAADGGSFLHIFKGQKPKSALYRCLLSPRGQEIHFPLFFVIIDEEAEAQIWEELAARGDEDSNQSLVSSYTSIWLKRDAKASFYHLQHWGPTTTQFHFQDVIQDSNSRLNVVSVGVGGRVSRTETAIHLNGAGAENKVLGVLFGDRAQHFENWITQNHTAQRTVSDIQIRAALKGSSSSFFSGLVSITKEAQKSDAYQSSKSLLLSKEAKADAIPNLEILADDVKCSHGAAVGPVDEDQRYYLETRGIAPDQAEEIIVQGFFEPVVAEVPSETVQDRLRTFIEEKLHRHE